MSVSAGEPWSAHGLKFHGLSLSGIRTSIAMPEFSLTFDVAQGFPYVLTLKNFFITHGHLDHAAGIPYILSQKAMTRQLGTRFFMPPSLVGPMKEIMAIWERIEEHQYSFEFVPFSPDQKVELNSQHFVKAFPSVHRIDTNGYTLFETRRKLKPEFHGLSQTELTEKARAGFVLNEAIEIPLVSFTGDTKIDFLDQRDWVRHSKILFVECTYMDEKKSVAHAREWGHLHLDELIARLPDIKSETIVLIHISSRYSMKEAHSILQRKLPEHERGRVVIFPGR